MTVIRQTNGFSLPLTRTNPWQIVNERSSNPNRRLLSNRMYCMSSKYENYRQDIIRNNVYKDIEQNHKNLMSRKERMGKKINVLRPMLRPISTIYRCTSFAMYNYLIRISILLFMLLFFYLALIGIDLNLVLMKLKSMLLGSISTSS